MQLENMLGDIQADENYLRHWINLLVLDTFNTATRLAKEASTPIRLMSNEYRHVELLTGDVRRGQTDGGTPEQFQELLEYTPGYRLRETT
ncbi:MAG: hypothetical protein ACK4QP_01265 [Pseudorhizobium sp.]